MDKAKLVQAVKNFINDEEGLTMVEYAVAGGMVAAVGALVMSGLGTAVSNEITGLTTAITG